MSFLTAAGWGMFFFVASLVDPSSTNWLGFALFYLVLFLALSGSAALFGFLLRFVALKKELAFNLVKVAFRQSYLFALFIIILLILKANDLFSWINLALLVLMFSVFELMVLSRNKNR
jgi:hypothetical protein